MDAHSPGMRPQQVLLLVIGVLVYGAALVAAVRDPSLDVDGLNGIIDRLYLLVAGPAFATVGIIILLNRPGYRLGRLLLLVGFGLTIASIGPLVLESLTPFRWAIRPVRGLIELIVEFAGVITVLAGSILVMAWFPSGRATTRLGHLIDVGSVVLVVAAIASIAWDDLAIAGLVAGLLAIALYALAMADLASRMRRTDPRSRTQMRLVLGSALVLVALMAALLVTGDRFPALWSIAISATILPAIAVAVSIGRYHLYDIDRLVSRSIAYTVVSVILLGVFATLLLASQAAMATATRGDPVPVAISTLIVAALFTPLRSRVQHIVDRRFDRDAYDATQTVEAYASRLRDELDLGTLARDLRGVTVRTVHPTTTSVWLRERPVR